MQLPTRITEGEQDICNYHGYEQIRNEAGMIKVMRTRIPLLIVSTPMWRGSRIKEKETWCGNPGTYPVVFGVVTVRGASGHAKEKLQEGKGSNP